MQAEDESVEVKAIEVKMMVLANEVLSMFRGLFPYEYLPEEDADAVPNYDADIKAVIRYDVDFADRSGGEIERWGNASSVSLKASTLMIIFQDGKVSATSRGHEVPEPKGCGG